MTAIDHYLQPCEVVSLQNCKYLYIFKWVWQFCNAAAPLGLLEFQGILTKTDFK